MKPILSLKSGQGHNEDPNEHLNEGSLKVARKKEVVWVSVGHQRLTTSLERSTRKHLVLHVLRGQNRVSMVISQTIHFKVMPNPFKMLLNSKNHGTII